MRAPYFLTAYGIARKHGFDGTEEEWLESLTAFYMAKQAGYTGKFEDWIEHLNDPIPEFAIGEVVTLDGGSDATVRVRGTKEKPVLDFGIPRGLGMADALALVGGTMKGIIDMGEFAITNLPEPAEDSQATRKDYVDNLFERATNAAQSAANTADAAIKTASSAMEVANSKANAAHQHNASNINSGIMPLERGGLGSTMLNIPPYALVRATSDREEYPYLWYEATANGALYAEAENGKPKFGTLPITQGGTSAVDAEAARKNLGAIRIDLLWENASPTSEFAPQTLSLGLSSYSMYIVVARSATDNEDSVSVIQRTGYNGNLVNFNYLNSYLLMSRGIDYVTGGSLKFRNAYANEATDNMKLIPIFIYGIKGVQKL